MPLSQDELIAWLTTSLDSDDDIAGDTALFTSGLLDSVMMQDLIMFFEEKTGTEVPAEDVTLDNFDTPAAIIAYAESLG
ncbi:MAG: phosphopantetheine-containing protein [Rhodobacterales bacterium]|nr:MAG: phosphopantetheine-containing protein [Rhodobacterales bacterium]